MADIVNVSTEDVSGKIVSTYVDEFDNVKKGQVLFCIDNTTEKIKVDELKAILKSVINKKLQLEKELERLKVVVPSEISALKKKIEETSLEVEKLRLKLSLLRTNYESGVKIAREKVQSAKDFLASARENFKFWKKRLQRYKNLYERMVISKEQLEEIENRFKSAKAGFSEALLRLSSAKENLKIYTNREVYLFNDDVENCKESGFDCIFLDMLRVEEKIPKVIDKLKNTGKFGVFIPNLYNIQKIVEKEINLH